MKYTVLDFVNGNNLGVGAYGWPLSESQKEAQRKIEESKLGSKKTKEKK